MHDAVTKYFQHKLAGKKIQGGDLVKIFQQSFDPQGFLDEKHQQERSRIGCEALLRFFKDEETRDSQPKFIEKEFSFILEDNKVRGRFDRVDEEKEGAVIMDFKTSEIKTQKDADKRTKESLQLSLYALAYQNIFGVLPKRVQLYFLESGIIGSAEIEEEDLGKVKETVKEVSAGIRQQKFEATPAYMACQYCAYNQICPSAEIK
jgi:DNA helicase-2/ATP-dependent DNA helicase PcrA